MMKDEVIYSKQCGGFFVVVKIYNFQGIMSVTFNQGLRIYGDRTRQYV